MDIFQAITIEMIMTVLVTVASVITAVGIIAKASGNTIRNFIKSVTREEKEELQSEFKQEISEMHEQSRDEMENLHKEYQQHLSVIVKDFEETTTEQNKSISEIVKNLEETTAELRNYIETQDNYNDRVEKTLCSLSRDRLNQGITHYIDKGHIDTYSLEIIEDLYSCYETLHGNGFITSLMKKVRKLPIVNKGKKGN